MQTAKAQISANGRVVIPASYRKAMGLKGGEILTLTLDENGLHLESQRQAMLRAQAIVRQHVQSGRSLSDELIAERREEAAREQVDG